MDSDKSRAQEEYIQYYMICIYLSRDYICPLDMIEVALRNRRIRKYKNPAN